MAITFDQFFSAIAEQESGARYSAVGVLVRGNRAYGKYQVMDFNIPSWTRQYYGKSLTPQQFLNNPAAQEAVARGKLKSYWNKYGPRGAASAWYSGNASLHMSTRSQSGGPSIKSYVDQVLAKAAKYPATGGTSSGTTKPSSSKGGETKPMARDEAAEQYGYVEALFDSNAELRKLFKRAVKGGWTTAKFQAELRDTKWWKSKPESERKYLIKQYGDPATAKQEKNQAYIKVRQMAQQMGVVDSASISRLLNKLTYNVLAKGWTDSQLRNEIGKHVYFANDTHQGEGGEAVEKLQSLAYNMGVTLSGKWYSDRARRVIRGIASIQDYEDEIRKMAKSTYSSWAKQIDAGQTVADLASPYMQSMSTLLELPPGSINLFNPTIKKALQYKDPQTRANALKPLWQFENELRNDKRWKQTKNAQDSIMQVAHQVLADFGLKY